MPPFEFYNKILQASTEKKLDARLKILESLSEKTLSQPDTSQIIYFTFIGNTHRKLNNKLKALAYAHECSQLLPKNKKIAKKTLSNAAYELGAIFQVNLLYTEAIKYYQISIDNSNNNAHKAYCYKLIADIFGEFGDFENQYSLIIKSKKFLFTDDFNLIDACDIYNSIGLYYLNIYKPEAALKYLDSSKIFVDKIIGNPEYHYLKANLNINYGNAYNFLNDVDTSEKFYMEAIRNYQLCQRKEDVLERGYTNLLWVNLLHNRWEKAKFWQEKAEKLLNSLDFPAKNLSRAKIYDNSGYLYYGMGDFDKSIMYLNKALEAFPLMNTNKPNFDLIRNRITILDIYNDLYECYLAYFRKKNEPKYLESALKYIYLADHLLDIMRQEHQGFQSKSFWREHTRNLYEAAIEACWLAKDTKKAFYFFEKSRAMLLLDDLNENYARKALPANIRKQEKDFHQKLIELQLRLEGTTENSAAHQNLIGEISSLKIEFNDFKKQIEKSNSVYYQIKYNQDFKDLPFFQNWLSENQFGAFVHYFTANNCAYLFKITPNSTKFIKLNSSIEKDIKQFSSLCSDFNNQNLNYKNFLNKSNLLYKYLISPLNLTGERIIIAFDGQFIPFEAISSSSAKPDFVINKFAFSYAYSGNFLLKNLNKINTSIFENQNQLLGIAPLNFKKSLDLNSLRASETSIKKIAQIYSADLLIENDATKNKFLNRFYKYPIVQLYTHANADTSDKEPTFYLNDDKIRMSEISVNNDTKTELMVLSACKTGVGKNVRGEGVFSLSRVFSSLGIPSLVTTLWSVDEKATYFITEKFHENLKEGLTKDVALQKAKLSFISNANQNELPNLWASIILIGDTSPLTEHFNGWYFFVGMSVVVIALLKIKLKK